MKHLSLFIALLFVVALGSGCVGRATVRTRPAAPAERVVVDISVFYDELAPYGRWFSLDGYGWVWTPYGVSAGWRPYTYGYWVYTDYGWTWVSRWRWGWAPFHYGRWVFHRHHGWVWKPGRVWAPAWVVWRHRPGWVGWAPMPPQIEWHDSIGLRARWDEIDTVVEPHWYSFVEERHFPARDLDRRLELPARNVTLLRETKNATDYAANENRVINRSVNVERIERASGRAVLRQRVVDSGSPGRGVEVRGGDVIFYRPRIEGETTDRAPRRVETPRRTPNPTAEQVRRREETEQRRLETQQARERQALENRQRIERAQPPTPPEEVNRRHENERRALEEQMRRERQILKGRQEERRKVEPDLPAPARKERDRKPAPERKPAAGRKP